MMIHDFYIASRARLCSSMFSIVPWDVGFTVLLKNPRLNIRFASSVLAKVHNRFVNCASVYRVILKKREKKRKALGFLF